MRDSAREGHAPSGLHGGVRAWRKRSRVQARPLCTLPSRPLGFQAWGGTKKERHRVPPVPLFRHALERVIPMCLLPLCPCCGKPIPDGETECVECGAECDD